MIISEDLAYQEFAYVILDFVEHRDFNKALCKCTIYDTMVNSKCWLEKGGVIDKKALSWGSDEYCASDAAIFLRKHLMESTGESIWGLTFILYPDGKFEIEYDYNKPEDYEETDEVITGEEINQTFLT